MLDIEAIKKRVAKWEKEVGNEAHVQDYELIAEDIPALLARVEELEARNKELERKNGEQEYALLTVIGHWEEWLNYPEQLRDNFRPIIDQIHAVVSKG